MVNKRTKKASFFFLQYEFCIYGVSHPWQYQLFHHQTSIFHWCTGRSRLFTYSDLTHTHTPLHFWELTSSNSSIMMTSWHEEQFPLTAFGAGCHCLQVQLTISLHYSFTGTPYQENFTSRFTWRPVTSRSSSQWANWKAVQHNSKKKKPKKRKV